MIVKFQLLHQDGTNAISKQPRENAQALFNDIIEMHISVINKKP